MDARVRRRFSPSPTQAKAFRRRLRRDCLIRSSPQKKAAPDSDWPSPRALSRNTADCSVTKPNQIAALYLKSCCHLLKTMQANILLIEDDQSTASPLQKVLLSEGYAVTVANQIGRASCRER